MSAREFRDDDEGYLAWIAGNPDGYVLNIRRSLAISDARACIRRGAARSAARIRAAARGPGRTSKSAPATCRSSISGRAKNVDGQITRCGICRPPSSGDITPEGPKPEAVDDREAHGDPASAGDLATRVAAHLQVTAREVQTLLLDPDRAVLGTLPRLLHARGRAVAWSPADDFCLAGELLAEDPAGEGWSISGDIREITPAGAAAAEIGRRCPVTSSR